MNIKKLIILVLVLIMTLVAVTCFAHIPESDLNIGGIYYGQPWEEVINMYGSPFANDAVHKNTYSFKCGNSTLLVTKGENGTVVGVSTGLVGVLPTNKGIRPDSFVEDVIKAYGQPDRKVTTHPKYRYIYFTDSGKCALVFGIGDGLFNRRREIVQWVFFSRCDNADTGNSGSESSSQTKKTEPVSTIPKSVQEMPESEFYIGGITIGQTFDSVEKIYGKPGKIEDEGFFQTYNYNDIFIVKGKLNNGYKVCSVAIYEKGLTTPSGFTGEMPYEVVTKKHGVGHEMKFKGEGLEAKLKGCKDYTYFCNNKQMVFLVDKNGVIKAIRVEDRDDQKYIEAKRKK